MLTIDGSQGEGGGQIFRSSLTLAMCQGTSVRIKNIRANRSKPGLLRQHLTCLRAAQEISDAEVSGAALGSMEVTFEPKAVKAGCYQFAVGSAGSASLVFQTVLLPLFFADETSELNLQGGTHNGSAPSFDYIEGCFLPILARMGYQSAVSLQRYGFFPAGGGAWQARIVPAGKLAVLNLNRRGEITGKQAMATSARLPAHITERELHHIQKKTGWPRGCLTQRMVDSVGPGNIVSLRVNFQHHSEYFEVVGEKQLAAERVAGRAVKALQDYLEAEAPVGEHLADQLLLPMALGKGGAFKTIKPSLHFTTNVEIIRQFLDVDVSIEQESDLVWQVTVK